MHLLPTSIPKFDNIPQKHNKMDHQREISVPHQFCMLFKLQLILGYFWAAALVMLLDANENKNRFLLSNLTKKARKNSHYSQGWACCPHGWGFLQNLKLLFCLRRCPKMCLWFARLRRENSIEYPARHVCHVLFWLLCLRHRLQETNH